MEGISYSSLLNKHYDKVLDLMAIKIDSKNKARELYKKVNNLTWKANDKEIEDIIDGFNIIWNAIPEEAFDVDTTDKLNARIYQFSKYIVAIDGEFKDHGFTLLVTYYLKVVRKYLNS